MSTANKLFQAASGNAGETVFVEDVFATHLYTSTGSALTITNGIDLSGEGGLVWIKDRDAAINHVLIDTERGKDAQLYIDTSGQITPGNRITAFNSNGFTLGTDSDVNTSSARDYCSWTFREQAGFFSVVTWTGDGNLSQNISHNLGSTPGMIICKRYNSTGNWISGHRYDYTKYLTLNTTNAETTWNGNWNASATQFTAHKAGNADYSLNDSGDTYVAYLFAHVPTTDYIEENFSAEYFADGSSPVSVTGPDGSGEYNFYTNSLNNNTYAKIAGTGYSTSGYENWDGISDVVYAATGNRYRVGTYKYTNGGVAPHYAVKYYTGYSGSTVDDEESFIVCGSYEGNGSTTGPVVELGFEPQWLMIKASSGSTGNWYMYDSMRGLTAISSNDAELYASSSGAEYAGRESINVTATGFQLATTNTANNANGSTYIYIAIRRPMKTPEAGTEVFKAISQAAGSSTSTEYDFGITGDLFFGIGESGSGASTVGKRVIDRLRGLGKAGSNAQQLKTTGTDAESGRSDFVQSGNQDAIQLDGSLFTTSFLTNVLFYAFKRATGFFDAVAYVADQTSTHAHNLGVTPEFAIIKQRNGTNGWKAYHSYLGNNQYLQLHTANAAATDTGWASVNASTFFLKANNGNNIAYLFATVPGVSKCGNYTGDGTSDGSHIIDCGFSAGARFVMIKRTDSTGDWWVFDTARGIVAGGDSRLALNLTDAAYSGIDDIDPHNSGFIVTNPGGSDLNVNNATYIFLAIA